MNQIPALYILMLNYWSGIKIGIEVELLFRMEPPKNANGSHA